MAIFSLLQTLDIPSLDLFFPVGASSEDFGFSIESEDGSRIDFGLTGMDIATTFDLFRATDAGLVRQIAITDIGRPVVAPIGGTIQSLLSLVLDGADRLTGTAGADGFFGGAGPDELTGLRGADSLFGEGGNDLVFAGPGADMVSGGPGRDEVYAGPGGDLVSGNGGADSLYGEDGDDILAGGTGDDLLLGNFGDDLLRGQGGDDILSGNDGNDTLLGGGGDDALTGFRGADVMEGGGGADLLRGQGQRDLIDGGAGDDTIVGGKAPDRLTGGDGADLFVFKTSTLLRDVGGSVETRVISDSRAGRSDRITDLDAGDRIDLTGFDADMDPSNGVTGFTFLAAPPAGDASATDLYLEDGALQNGTGDLFVRVGADAVLTADDLIL